MHTVETLYRVETIKNKKTGLLIAMCEELPGLYAHGRTQEEIDERVPVALKALLEAKGHKIAEVVRCDDELAGFEANVARYALENCVPA